MITPFNIYSFLKTPEDYLFNLQKKQGDPFLLALPGTPKILLTGNSELAQAIFSAIPNNFKPSEKNPVAPMLGKNGLIMQSDPEHMSCRKDFSPYFSKNNLMPFSSSIVDVFLNSYHEKENSGTLIVQDFAFEATLRIILKLLFPHLNSTETNQANELVDNLLKSYSASFLFISPWISGAWKNFNQKKTELDNVFYEFFLTGVQAKTPSPLSCLADFPKDQVVDHIRTFIVAGHETSATSLSWVLYYIHENNLIKEHLQKELNIYDQKISTSDFVETILRNEYLECVVREALRIHPPVPFITRKIITKDFKLGNQLLNINDEIGVCISLLHRQPHVWQNPNDFLPERFLKRKYLPHEYAPFGGGTRKCIGSELAILEIKILTGLFIKYYQAELLPANTPTAEAIQITIGPKKPIALAYTKRG